MNLRGTFAGFPRRWLIHWVTCAVITLLFFSFFKLFDFENNALFRTLDRAGSDAIARVYRPRGDEKVRVMLIDRKRSLIPTLRRTPRME